jgi:hypothetical protein
MSLIAAGAAEAVRGRRRSEEEEEEEAEEEAEGVNRRWGAGGDRGTAEDVEGVRETTTGTGVGDADESRESVRWIFWERADGWVKLRLDVRLRSSFWVW